MLGIWDYTVILTYASLLSAVCGIMVALDNTGHPIIGVVFLLFCGLCDTFDGRVARTKKNRTKKEKAFGIQIDSLSDLAAFGILPAAIGGGLYRHEIMIFQQTGLSTLLISCPKLVLYAVGAVFTLMALVRLAYFNVTVEETQPSNGEKYYFGLPVTSSALIFPTFMLINYLCYRNGADVSFMYYVVMIITGCLFVKPFKLVKPESKWIYLMVFVGAVEFIAALCIKLL